MSGLYIKWLLSALCGGAGCGLAGFLLVSLNLPFMGVCLAHAALAGAVISYFFGTPPLLTALVFSTAVAAIIGPAADRTRTQANTVMSIIFSLTLGLAFLGIGLMQNRRTELLGLMWGNLLLVSWNDLWPLALACLLPLLLVVAFAKETKAVLFDREIARACGIHAATIYYALIVLCGFVVTVNLQIVGGLMLYSLLTNPAVAALQLTSGFRSGLAVSMILGCVCAMGGLALSFGLNWPAGSSIVLVSVLMYITALLLRSHVRKVPAAEAYRTW